MLWNEPDAGLSKATSPGQAGAWKFVAFVGKSVLRNQCGRIEFPVCLEHRFGCLDPDALRRGRKGKRAGGREAKRRDRSRVEGLPSIPSVPALDAQGPIVRHGIFDTTTNRSAHEVLAVEGDRCREASESDEIGASPHVGEG